MSSTDRPDEAAHEPTRRDFLTARRARAAEAEPPAPDVPVAGPTVRVGRTLMACDFDVILNPGPASQIDAAVAALDEIERIEDQISVYRETSELSRVNRAAAASEIRVDTRLFALLDRARALAVRTGGAFDPTSGPLVALWKQCRSAGRIPTESELAAARACVGIDQVSLDESRSTVRYARPGVRVDFGSIGKGYALDEAAARLHEAGTTSFLLHGGRSSVLARGPHGAWPGWPIGLRHPVFPDRHLATILLRDRALGTSGVAVQQFRVAGRRFGHIVDPRSGWPVEGMHSVTVMAPTAAEADALSTGFFVGGVEKGLQDCHNHPEIGAILMPAARAGQRLQVIVCQIDPQDIFFEPDLPAEIVWASGGGLPCLP
jgi:thiamine biosynthesis lipoprotein